MSRHVANWDEQREALNEYLRSLAQVMLDRRENRRESLMADGWSKRAARDPEGPAAAFQEQVSRHAHGLKPNLSDRKSKRRHSSEPVDFTPYYQRGGFDPVEERRRLDGGSEYSVDASTLGEGPPDWFPPGHDGERGDPGDGRPLSGTDASDPWHD